MENTVADFWQMVWEQNVRIIVAATDDKVKHKTHLPKAETNQYLPKAETNQTYLTFLCLRCSFAKLASQNGGSCTMLCKGFISSYGYD